MIFISTGVCECVCVYIEVVVVVSVSEKGRHNKKRRAWCGLGEGGSDLPKQVVVEATCSSNKQTGVDTCNSRNKKDRKGNPNKSEMDTNSCRREVGEKINTKGTQ